jgi:hypothetical protein
MPAGMRVLLGIACLFGAFGLMAFGGIGLLFTLGADPFDPGSSGFTFAMLCLGALLAWQGVRLLRAAFGP